MSFGCQPGNWPPITFQQADFLKMIAFFEKKVLSLRFVKNGGVSQLVINQFPFSIFTAPIDFVSPH
jgi:hypothetical protein